MQLAAVDWVVLGAYAVFALAVGAWFARRAGRGVDDYFLSGRTLPWWVTGTSMVATTFAADTPLVIGGWVRQSGVWKNWLWWCYAVGTLLTTFLFARYWRRGGVMTTAELAELRYGGRQARVLRGFLGVYHGGITNTIVLCWVLLAAVKIMDVLLGIDPILGLVVACGIALSYALASGFWGVVMTDMVQFVIAMTGSIVLAVVAWNAVGGLDAVVASGRAGGDILAFLPSAGSASGSGFWTTSLAAVCVYLGVAWWAVDSVDGGGLVVQRIAASRDEREGRLAVLWYAIAHNALRPWPWILVALASLVVLPTIEVASPIDGVCVHASETAVVIESADGDRTEVTAPASASDWRPLPVVAEGTSVAVGQAILRTDDERAYVVMLGRYLPAGLLGLAVAALLAAFMSTIDTHVNLAASFWVNDVYARFLRPGRSGAHYVAAARVASFIVMVLAALLASQAQSISRLFLFFLSFLAGVGPVYLARWLWWRVTAATEIAAMTASSLGTVVLTFVPLSWPESALSPGGELEPEGRLCLVAAFSMVAAGLVTVLRRPPDPAALVTFYTRVRPVGAWGPVRRLVSVGPPRGELPRALFGAAAGLFLVIGCTLAAGFWFLGRGRDSAAAAALAIMGSIGVMAVLRRETKPKS